MRVVAQHDDHSDKHHIYRREEYKKAPQQPMEKRKRQRTSHHPRTKLTPKEAQYRTSAKKHQVAQKAMADNQSRLMITG